MRKNYPVSNTIILASMAVCILFFLGMFTIKAYMGVQAKSEDKDVFRECIGSVFPVISRGYELNRNDIPPEEDENDLYKKMFSTIYPIIDDTEIAYVDRVQISRTETNDTSTNVNENRMDNTNKENTNTNYEIISSQKVPIPGKVKFDFSKPIVYIYHTHATESYSPKSEGNYHSIDEPGTVREVGTKLAEQLEKKGVKVIHDKTVHDYPSYNESYRRSLNTIQNALQKNKSVKIVIDIHRDAADYKKERNIPVIDGQKTATFSIVVGTGNDNVKQLQAFAEYILYKTDTIYPKLGEGIISKPYKFNEYVSDYYILLEIGDNENNIKEALKTAECFAEILHSVIEDIKE